MGLCITRWYSNRCNETIILSSFEYSSNQNRISHNIAVLSICQCREENAAPHAGKHFVDAVERKKNKYRGSVPATNSLLPLAMSTCGEVGLDVHALIKELAIRQVEHRSEIHSSESQHLSEGTEVACIRREFSSVL